ncbi:MAG: type VI secretion system accessory protein TagJ [Pseudomonadota bacterium]
MRAEELLKSGDLDGALAALQERVRQSPEDASLRVFLFQLLCVLGDWQRAIKQLKACATLDKAAAPMARMYREAIICEIYREKVFRGEKAPLIFGEPASWIADLIGALKLEVGRHAQAADALRAQALEAAPAVPGTLDGVPFAWIADADPRLGPLLEIIVNGRYFWAPFSTIHRIAIEPPVDLRDRVWMPASVTWSNGGDAVCLIPTRYPGSTGSRDPRHKLARATDWETSGDGVTAGLGQRVLITESAEVALMDLRLLVIGDPPAVADAPDTMVANHG